MKNGAKNAAIIGANKEGLKLLPLLLRDPNTKVRVIVDPNRDAMIFKLNELGYRLSSRLDIKTTTDLNDLRKFPNLDIVINALQDPAVSKFLEAPEFKDVEKLGPLSTRLVWGVRASEGGEGAGDREQVEVLASLREIVDSVRLIIDRKELLSLILKLAIESTHAECASIMLVYPDEKALRVETAKGIDVEFARRIRVAIGEGISGKVAASGKPVIVSGRASSEEFVQPVKRTDVKSAMCVPLKINREVIGVINVSTGESGYAFTDNDLSFLVELAVLAAEVIERSNEYERLRADAAKYGFWREIEGVMATDLPLEKRLGNLARKVVEIVPGLTCHIYLYDEATKGLLLKASSTREAAGLGLMGIRPGEGIEGWAMESKKDVFLVDRNGENDEKRVYLSLPMVHEDTLVGTLSAQIVSSQGLSKYHESFLKDIRSFVAKSVYGLEERERETEKRKKLSGVDEAGFAMISIPDAQALLNTIARKSASILSADGSLFRMRQRGTQKFQTASSSGLEDRDVRQQFLPLEKETVMEVLRKGEPVAREFSGELSPYIKSVLSQPLKSEGEVLGVLTLFNKRCEGQLHPCAFSGTDREIAGRLAVYAAKALENILRKEEVVVKAEEVEKPEDVLRPLALLEKKVEQELNRSRRLDQSMVLATLRVAGLKDLAIDNRDELESRLMDCLRKKTRSFDFVIKLNEELTGLLLLDTGEKVSRVIESIAAVLNEDPVLGRAFAEGKLDVFYGYGVFPGDGDSFAALYSKASRRERLDLDRSYESELKSDVK
ncbi:MAG TPA: GAF domain-containing protein [Thermodesulfobacteriota bacterium]|nr:GAF domain-containing protein [Thermodesulfobacteriota bacterium]